MTCKTAQKWLSDHLNSPIDAVLKDNVETHLKTCPRCPRYLTELKKIDEIIKLKCAEQPSTQYWDTYWPRLKDRLKQAT